MPFEILTRASIERRRHWIDEIAQISGQFGDDTARINRELTAEIGRDGPAALFDHIRLCGSIPEQYGHDTSEEKLYSKYTDTVLAAAFRHIGLKSVVLEERADAADVEAVGERYSLVADAKAFRLSRSAKNQKDFKIDAMHGWKRGKPHAVVVCPIYQLPTRHSQIYKQAIDRDVCVFSYAHLAVIANFSDVAGKSPAQKLLFTVLKCTEELNPTKDAIAYWTSVNRAMLGFDNTVLPLWQREKSATLDAIAVARKEALTTLANERERLMRMSHSEAIGQLIRYRRIDGRETVIRSVSDNGLLAVS